jgi:capsular polysaccharide transport system permease protein
LNETSLTATVEGSSTANRRAESTVAESRSLVVEGEANPLGTQLPPPTDGEEPAKPRTGFWARYRLFIVSVVVPMLIGAGFLLFISPRYSSTATFIVRSIDRSASQPAVQSVVQGAGASIVSDETYAVNAYLASRDIVDLLVRNDRLLQILSRPEGDVFFRYPTPWLPDNKEFLYRRFQWMATADVDPVTDLSTIEVNAFTPHDAQALARAMLNYAEAFVNRLNERSYRSQLSVADRFVTEAQKNLEAIEAELKAFRNASGSVDPNLVAQSKLNVIEGLSQQLAQIEASIKQQRTLVSSSPTLAPLRAQAQSYRDEIDKEKLAIAGGPRSEAVKLQTYDQLTLRRDLAVKALAEAETQKAQARLDAERQHLYIQVVSQPSLAIDFARYPRITWDLLALLGICLAVYQVVRKLRDFAMEHRP